MIATRESSWCLALLVSLMVMLTADGELAADEALRKDKSPSGGVPRTWALLVGVEKYQRVVSLQYTINDVQRLSQTLQQRNGLPISQILELTDAGSRQDAQPLRATLLTQIPKWLSRVRTDDTVIVFFSGHGFRGKQGALYLAPLDCDPNQLLETGLAVEWLRDQLAECPATVKLLILDACHAGSEKGGESIEARVKDLVEPFRNAGVLTLASSTDEEKSLIWEEKQQSLFSYWLTQGLRGHADADGNSLVDVDELYEFVHRQVTHSAKTRFSRQQTPVRIVRASSAGVPIAVRLTPLTLKQVLNDIAEQLAWACEERKLSRLGFLEFSIESQLGEFLGADYGLVGRYCASELEQRLTVLGKGKFSVVDRRRMQTALKEKKFTLDSLGSREALSDLAASVGGMPAIGLGILRGRAGRIVTLQCRLVEISSDTVLASASGTAQLSESEWAMLGRSAQVRPEDRMPELPGTSAVARPESDRVIERLDVRAQESHPLADPQFPFRIGLHVNGKERPGIIKGNDYIIPLRKGEVYEIHIENRGNQQVMMRLLVDGLSTLPQPDSESESSARGIVAYRVAAPVNLEDARPWVLDPRRSRKNAVRGFVSETGPQGKLLQFTVVDAAQSLAARQQYTEQLGLITAAFYAPMSQDRSVGTGAGEQKFEALTEHGGLRPGNLLAVVHLRYVDADRRP